MSMFIKTIAELNKKGSIAELDAALAKAVHQVLTTGKPGKLTYTVTIKPDNLEGESLKISDNIKVTTAEPLRRPSIFFHHEDGIISRDMPGQPELPIRGLDAPEGAQPPVAPPVAEERQPVAAAQ